MYSLLIYVLATSCLLIGSILTYNNNLSDYFYVSGSGLFFLRSVFEFISRISRINKQKYKGIIYENYNDEEIGIF